MPRECYERFDRAPRGKERFGTATTGVMNMAKTARDDLFDRLRSGGLRKRVAKNLADGLNTARGSKPSKSVDTALEQLKALTAEIEDRANGGPSNRSAAAKKAAATRKRNADRRSTAAKKAARTRAKSR
jgi:hypothetical protein